jgi:hypothetical protein
MPGVPFDYKIGATARLNHLWKHAGTEHVAFLSDVAQLEPRWLQALLTFSCDLSVGLAFGRCLKGSGGKALLFDEPGGMTASTGTPVSSRGTVQREALNVDRAICATRRTTLARLNGFDPRFHPELANLDYCLRLSMLGTRTVYTPFCCTAKDDEGVLELCEAQELALFFARWGPRIEIDPALHALFNLNAATTPRSEIKWWSEVISGL